MDVKVSAEGKGEAVVQGVLRYNLLEPEATESVFDINGGLRHGAGSGERRRERRRDASPSTRPSL